MKLKITLVALISCALLSAQSFREVQLPKPDKLNPLFIGPIFKSTIHYGATPPDYNGKVIVFNHGYIDLNQLQFLFDNDFYQNAYDEGYQAVFVATTRGKGLWVNGELLAESIDIITQKYNVPDVYIVAHSNGGKASEAAMIRYGKKDKVKQVFALGTPFWGTYIADVSQMPWLNWAWRLTGLNDGALTSTTYYNRDVVRPYLDNDPNNEPEKFVVLGASGYYNGSNVLIRGAFTLTGGIILPVQGINDGVAPYRSTLRPGATYVFRKNDRRAIFDHIDVGIGQFSWPFIKPFLDGNTQKSQENEQQTSNPYRMESNYYIVHSDNEYDAITLDANSSYAIAEIIHEDAKATFSVLAPTKMIKSARILSSETHHISIPIAEKKVQLKSNSRYAAFVKQNNGIDMILEHDSSKSRMLKVSFSTNQKSQALLKEAIVRGVIIKKAEINGIVMESNPEIIEFEKVNGSYQFDTSYLDAGVYGLFLSGESEGSFKRSIISGFVVGDIEKGLSSFGEQNSLLPSENRLQITPTLVTNTAKLSLSGNPIAEKLSVTIYDLTGKSIKSFELGPNDTSDFIISDDIQALQKGIYLLKADKYPTIQFVKR